MKTRTKTRKSGKEPDAELAIARSRRGGDLGVETDCNLAATNLHPGEPHNGTEKPRAGLTAGEGDGSPETETGDALACRSLQELQRRRAAALKCRMAADNQLAALVAQELRFTPELQAQDLKASRAAATQLIAMIDAGKPVPEAWQSTARNVDGLVMASQGTRDGFDVFVRQLEKAMLRLAKSLTVSRWANQPHQRGFGLLSLATIIGETGDLSQYANPGKVWKRLGLAPFNGKMPSTWRRSGGLTTEQWIEVGYRPCRRSIVYVIGENLVKLNKGPYRQRYDEAKAAAVEKHPDWTPLHAHNHAMLLASKRLIRELWVAWRSHASEIA